MLYQLTNLPRWPTLAASTLGIVVPSAIWLTEPPGQNAELKILTSPLAGVLDLILLVILWSLIGVIVYHTIRQLRMVSRIYAHYTHINLFQALPLYAFSKLTARTAIGIAFATYIWYSVQAESRFLSQTFTGIITTAPGIPVVVATFILPLLGIHRLLQAEKERLQSEASQQLEMVITEIHERTKAGDYTQMAGLSQTMDSLIKEQSVLEKISTWPWQSETVRWLVTALLLPLVLWIATKLLERIATF